MTTVSTPISQHLMINQIRYVVRMIVCPSEHPLHLGKQSDIGFQIGHIETSSYYPIETFVSKMSETSSEVEQETRSHE